MKGLIETANRKTEKVFLVGTAQRDQEEWQIRESMRELAELALTAGADVISEGFQRLDKPVAATYIGPGKAESFAEECKALEIDTVIFDDELSPAQSRNLEQIFDCKILDRTALILDIFAQRARTREGKLQVELAQLQHLYPRLTGFWTHLSRQKGGIGMRGDGESQLETDRRRIQEKISRLQSDLETVRRQRGTQRQGRQRHLWPLASIVGYTNAGKSTLLNALTGSDALSEDKLFATLDPTTRRLRLPTNQNILLSDTVGFIRKLPHGLIESFKATLEEVVEADLLLHVVDISHPHAHQQIQAVNDVLNEIEAGSKPTLMVYNKVDRLDSAEQKAHWLTEFPNARFISAHTEEGFVELMEEISRQMRPIRRKLSLCIPHSESALMARLYRLGEVLSQNYDGPEAHFEVLLPPHVLYDFEKYIIPDWCDFPESTDVHERLNENENESEIESESIQRSVPGSGGGVSGVDRSEIPTIGSDDQGSSDGRTASRTTSPHRG